MGFCRRNHAIFQVLVIGFLVATFAPHVTSTFLHGTELNNLERVSMWLRLDFLSPVTGCKVTYGKVVYLNKMFGENVLMCDTPQSRTHDAFLDYF